jgi:hypothetical protein
MIHLIEKKVTQEEFAEMLKALEVYIKLAVDVEKEILAGGGALHADCEAVLLENGSLQENVWGADWFPHSREVTFESLINIRPRHGNVSLEVKDERIRNKIETIVRGYFEDTEL